MKVLSRWRAAGLHFLISLAIAAAVVMLMLELWYPPPLFEAAGGAGLLLILVGVDVVLGPLLTLIVFRAGKPSLRFDLSVIGLVQVLALAYGCHIVALARPGFIVFVKDRFEVATAAELEPAALAEAKYPEFRAVPWGGPRFAAADNPEDPAERQGLLTLALSGLDLQHFPRYYVPYGERTRQVLARAQTVGELRKSEPETAKAVDAWLAREGVREADVRCLMLRARQAWVAVLVHPQTAQPVKMLLGERIAM